MGNPYPLTDWERELIYSHRPKPLLSGDDITALADLLNDLDNSGARVCGTLEFKGRTLPLGFDGVAGKHVVSL